MHTYNELLNPFLVHILGPNSIILECPLTQCKVVFLNFFHSYKLSNIINPVVSLSVIITAYNYIRITSNWLSTPNGSTHLYVQSTYCVTHLFESSRQSTGAAAIVILIRGSVRLCIW